MAIPNSDKITKTVQEVLDMNPKAVSVAVLMEDGSMAVRSSADSVAVAHWLFNRALFEMSVYERMIVETAEGTDDEFQ